MSGKFEGALDDAGAGKSKAESSDEALRSLVMAWRKIVAWTKTVHDLEG